jgi:hypothetical protein
MGNETYRIEIKSPLLRPGITISTEVSERYLVKTLANLLEYAREFNRMQKKQREGGLERKSGR